MGLQGQQANNSFGSESSSDYANGGDARRDISRGVPPDFGISW
jgi:hypothetical protein